MSSWPRAASSTSTPPSEAKARPVRSGCGRAAVPPRRSTTRGLDVEDRSGSGALGTAHRRTHLIRGDADGARVAQFDDRGANPSLIPLDRAERFQSQALPVRCPVGARRGLAEQAGIPILKMGTGCSTSAAHAITMMPARPTSTGPRPRMALSRPTILQRGLRTNGSRFPDCLRSPARRAPASRWRASENICPDRPPDDTEWPGVRSRVNGSDARRAASRGDSRTDLCRNANGMFIASRTASHHPVDRLLPLTAG